jgi:hypothetical protein
MRTKLFQLRFGTSLYLRVLPIDPTTAGIKQIWGTRLFAMMAPRWLLYTYTHPSSPLTPCSKRHSWLYWKRWSMLLDISAFCVRVPKHTRSHDRRRSLEYKTSWWNEHWATNIVLQVSPFDSTTWTQEWLKNKVVLHNVLKSIQVAFFYWKNLFSNRVDTLILQSPNWVKWISCVHQSIPWTIPWMPSGCQTGTNSCYLYWRSYWHSSRPRYPQYQGVHIEKKDIEVDIGRSDKEVCNHNAMAGTRRWKGWRESIAGIREPSTEVYGTCQCHEGNPFNSIGGL